MEYQFRYQENWCPGPTWFPLIFRELVTFHYLLFWHSFSTPGNNSPSISLSPFWYYLGIGKGWVTMTHYNPCEGGNLSLSTQASVAWSGLWSDFPVLITFSLAAGSVFAVLLCGSFSEAKILSFCLFVFYQLPMAFLCCCLFQ
jgi:hypothetical protein